MRPAHPPASPAGDMARPAVPVALTIAGFDPSSGAGITADLKTFAAHGIYGVAAITALTVQSTQGVRSVHPVESTVVRSMLECLADDVALAGIKIGMLATASNAETIGEFLSNCKVPPEKIVLDPVLRSSSGRMLLEQNGLAVLRQDLLRTIGWITPNTDELAWFTGMPCSTRAEIAQAAAHLKREAAALGNNGLRVVATGGHLESPDDLLLDGDDELWLAGERVETEATHGTGCAFASALTAQLMAGLAPAKAVAAAKAFVTGALRAAYPVGQGKGPMHHLHPLNIAR